MLIGFRTKRLLQSFQLADGKTEAQKNSESSAFPEHITVRIEVGHWAP